MVACETLSRVAASSTVTRPLSVSSSRSAFQRAYRSTGASFARSVSTVCTIMRERPPQRRGRCANWRALRAPCTMVRETSQNAHKCKGGRPVPHVDEEIASQPACWGLAVDLATRCAMLPAPGERVAVLGCGTSWFMAMAYAALREAAGQGVTDAFPASEFPAGRRYDRVLAITRSGTTTEVLDALSATDARTVAVVGDPDSPVAHRADEVVPLPFADEHSVVQTRFATSALILLRAHLGEDLGTAAADAAEAVRAPLPLDPGTVEQVSFLGRGWTVG